MARENVEVVRRIYDAISRGDTETVLDLYDSEVTWDFSRSPFASVFAQTVYRGHDELRAFTRERFEPWREWNDELEELVESGDQVISVVRTVGRGRARGAQGGMTHAGVWSIREGKVAGVDGYASRDEALQAAGPE